MVPYSAQIKPHIPVFLGGPSPTTQLRIVGRAQERFQRKMHGSPRRVWFGTTKGLSSAAKVVLASGHRA